MSFITEEISFQGSQLTHCKVIQCNQHHLLKTGIKHIFMDIWDHQVKLDAETNCSYWSGTPTDNSDNQCEDVLRFKSICWNIHFKLFVRLSDEIKTNSHIDTLLFVCKHKNLWRPTYWNAMAKIKLLMLFICICGDML